jgi:glucose-6-phosphate 1-dehydrogenase
MASSSRLDAPASSGFGAAPAGARVSAARRPDNHVIVVFGATGDLARRKLLPGLFHLAAAGLMPEEYQVIGSARRTMTDEKFRELARQAAAEFGISEPNEAAWQDFGRRLSFTSAEPGRTAALAAAIEQAEHQIGGSPRRLFHLAVPPVAFEPTVAMLGAMGLAPGSRVIIEKPFGTDLASARALNQTLHASFDESQVFRIDHFLGKESVENILAFRFVNGLFEPVWNRKHIAYVQIDVPETLSIEGRGGFYDATGAYRDMVVTHLFQVLGFVAMEPPTSLDARHLRAETAKVFDALKPLDTAHVVRGQYAGYQDEPGVAPGSQTETLAAVRAEIDNWRWAGIPFFLRSGKRMAASRQVITLGFHEPPLRMFPARVAGTNGRHNEIAIDFADPGSITTSFLAKEPGATMKLGAAEMTFRYTDSFQAANSLEAYERLILEAMLGDQSLFTTAASVERLWEISAPLLDNPPAIQRYAPGSWGPKPALHHLTAPYHWHLPSAPPPNAEPSAPYQT